MIFINWYNQSKLLFDHFPSSYKDQGRRGMMLGLFGITPRTCCPQQRLRWLCSKVSEVTSQWKWARSLVVRAWRTVYSSPYWLWCGLQDRSTENGNGWPHNLLGPRPDQNGFSCVSSPLTCPLGGNTPFRAFRTNYLHWRDYLSARCTLSRSSTVLPRWRW